MHIGYEKNTSLYPKTGKPFFNRYNIELSVLFIQNERIIIFLLIFIAYNIPEKNDTNHPGLLHRAQIKL